VKIPFALVKSSLVFVLVEGWQLPALKFNMVNPFKEGGWQLPALKFIKSHR
jgi:hypothetical protein